MKTGRLAGLWLSVILGSVAILLAISALAMTVR